MATNKKALANIYIWGVVGCALGVLGVSYFARGPDYALRLTQKGATFLIAFPDDSTKLIELQTDLPEPEAALGERPPAVLACELLFGRESLELDAKRAELRSIQLRLDSGERPP